MGCLACNTDIHWECLRPDGIYCCCPTGPEASEITFTGLLEPVGIKGGYKNANDMIDPLSTGRKRAAELKPIHEGMTCEWSGLAQAGGGVYPIIGCLDSPARHIHHGPDKDTTNNADLNLHRVCSKCHNRWHSLNDKFYGNRPPAGHPFVPPAHVYYPHNPEAKATDEQVLAHELWWNLKSKHRKTGYDNIGTTGAARELVLVGGENHSSGGEEESVDSDSPSPE